MRIVSAALCLILAIGIFFSCSKEKSFELAAPAKGSLKSDVSGDCLPKNAVGAYIAGTALTDSNYLDVQVDVSTAGTYSIRTDTVNGYSFSGIGSFDHAGINDIHLKAIGTPTTAQQDQFTVIFDTSFCFVNVTVLPEGSISGPAQFTLQGSGDTCMIASVAGSYVQNTPLTADNTVTIRINATTPGTYNVTTNSINDFQFSGAGTIPAPGEQTITLTASGTPTTEGTTTFTVTAGSTTCTFSVNVSASSGPPPVVTTDHFPLSTNSYWTYSDDLGNPEDSVKVTDKGNVTITGVPNTYNLFVTTTGDGTSVDTAVYRKSGNDYYTYIPVDQYFATRLDQQQWGDVLFLKEGLSTGDTWTSAEFSGTEGGQPAKVQYQFQCVSATASLNANGTSYSNLYQIKCTPVTSINGGAYANAGEEIDFYYGAGIGLIYEKGSFNGTTQFERSLLHYRLF
jgi:hypothetical protein